MITGAADFFRLLWIAIIFVVPLYLLSLIVLPIYDAAFPWPTAVTELVTRYPDQKRLCLGVGFSSQSNSKSHSTEYQRTFLLFSGFFQNLQQVTVVETTINETARLEVISSSISLFLQACIYIGCAIFTWKISIPWTKRSFHKNKAQQSD